jgi:hypothetical protein
MHKRVEIHLKLIGRMDAASQATLMKHTSEIAET